jgi:dihydroorotate dehydrogenase (fumarate)
MLCSALLKNGVNHLRTVEQEMRNWMEKHEYESVSQMRGSISQLKCENPTAFERAQYIRAVTTYKMS